MRRVVSLYLPTWPTDRLRRRLGADTPSPETPVVLAGRLGRKRVVIAADAAAQRQRLYPGTAATQARALVGNPARALLALAGAALSSLVAWVIAIIGGGFVLLASPSCGRWPGLKLSRKSELRPSPRLLWPCTPSSPWSFFASPPVG